MVIDKQAAIPPLSGTVTVRGIEKPVVIIRDQWGIPHVCAETTADVFSGQGFAMAQDRLFQMEYQGQLGFQSDRTWQSPTFLSVPQDQDNGLFAHR
jgi:hypothetical protein